MNNSTSHQENQMLQNCFRKLVFLARISTAIASLMYLLVSTPAFAAIELADSAPVVIRESDRVIENLSINSGTSDKCAVEITNAKNVTIRNLEITHANMGICAYNVENLHIHDIRLKSTTAPEKGPHCRAGVSECSQDRSKWAEPDLRIAIKLDKTPNARIERIDTRLPSTGLFVHRSSGTQLEDIVCIDMRGPRPRGQCVIFVYTDNASLTGFYVKGYKNQSHYEDNINMYYSSNVIVTDGLIDGNWSIHGVGVIADVGSHDITVQDVDVMNTGVAAVSVWSNEDDKVGRNFHAKNIRAKDTHCDSRYGGKPSSDGLVFVMHPKAVNPRFENAQFFNHCREQKHYCIPETSCRQLPGGFADIREENFTPKEPLALRFPWEEVTPEIISITVD